MRKTSGCSIPENARITHHGSGPKYPITQAGNTIRFAGFIFTAGDFQYYVLSRTGYEMAGQSPCVKPLSFQSVRGRLIPGRPLVVCQPK